MNIALEDFPLVWDSKYGGNGYFAGTADGIVTINGKAASREIVCFNAKTLEVVRKVWSFDNGRYLVPNLSTNFTYLLIARDHDAEYAPIGWDQRLPATKLTYAEQQAKLTEWEKSA